MGEKNASMFVDSPSVASDSSPSRERNLKSKFSPLIWEGGVAGGGCLKNLPYNTLQCSHQSH